MLELEVVPERLLGCEQWEFILGGYPSAYSVTLNNMRFIYILRCKQSVFLLQTGHFNTLELVIVKLIN